MLRQLKEHNGTHMHNTTDVDTAQRAIRAIEIEMGSPSPTPSLAGRGEDTWGESFLFGLSIPRDLRRERITQRLKTRLKEGMVDEVRGLLDEGIPAEDLTYYGLEYKYVTEYVTDVLSYDEMFSRLEIAIHQFAKRQMTWFRGMERRGLAIHWIDATLPTEEKVTQILQLSNL
jgi:tRNA dimethylallyltransferase